jgi:hypothetical protein
MKVKELKALIRESVLKALREGEQLGLPLVDLKGQQPVSVKLSQRGMKIRKDDLVLALDSGLPPDASDEDLMRTVDALMAGQPVELDKAIVAKMLKSPYLGPMASDLFQVA